MPIWFHAIGSLPPFGRCSSATATSGSTTSGSATSAIGWASRRGAPRSRSARDVLPRVSQPAWAPRRGDRRRRRGRAESARPALGGGAWHRGESRDHAPPAEARLCDLLGEMRPELAARVPDSHERTALWYRIVDSDVIEFVRRGDMEGARERIDELVSEDKGSVGLEVPRLKPGPGTALPLRAVTHRAHSSEWGHSEPGVVYLVGAGPGDPGLITVEGLEILRSADVVVYDRLVAPVLVTEAPPGAERVFVGKRPHGGGANLAQDEINALLVERARRGLTVVRLKGGDPFVFGRGAEECEALHAAGVPFRVVPGVTSAIAVPAAARIPVTHRRLASAFAVVTGHGCDGVSNLDWQSLARVPALVVLMALSALPEVAV